MIELDPTISPAKFESFLKKAGVPYGGWASTPGAKTIEHLWDELRTRKSKIQYEEVGEEGDKSIVNVERHVDSVLIDVRCFYTDNSTLQLCEDRVRVDGEKKLPRSDFTVTGKISTSAPDAVKECLREKLGFEGEFLFIAVRDGQSPVTAAQRFVQGAPRRESCFIVVKGGFNEIAENDDEENGQEKKAGKDPTSFPGLPTFRDLRQFLCIIPRSACQPSESIARKHENVEVVYKWSYLTDDDSDMSVVRSLS